MSRGYLIKNYYSNTDEKSINLSGHDVITSTFDKHYDDLIEQFYFSTMVRLVGLIII